MGIYGQDWASYQGSHPSASGLAFVFVKVTEGESYVNPYWQTQVADITSAGAVVGKYHYPHMHNSAASEVTYFLSKANFKTGEMAVLDWEGYDANNANLTNAERLAYKESFLTYLKKQLPHNPVGMYCNTDYWLNVDTTSHTGDFLWIATSGKAAGQPGIKAAWKFHQYGAAGVDKDYGNFADAAALKTWVASFAPKPPVVVPPVIAPTKPVITPIPPEDIVTPQDKQDIINGVLAELPAAIWNFNLTRRKDDWTAQPEKPALAAHWFVEGLDIDFRAVQSKLADLETKVAALTPKA